MQQEILEQSQTTRKLASIQRIAKLVPIEGADMIEKAEVLGWELVVKKGEFKEGDWCVYCEIDSFMPDKPEFEFLKPRGMRVRTVKLKGQISQGICFPLSILPESFDVLHGNIEDEIVGLDVTEQLGIIKYEPSIPACLAGKVKGNFPSFIPKTDEIRVQSLQKLLYDNSGRECYITEKLDGSSATFYLKDGVFGVCSRNMDLLETEENSFWKAAKAMDIENKLRLFFGNDNVALQGEIIGEGIQNNKYKLKGQEVRFFSLFNIDKFKYVQFDLMVTCMKLMNLPLVPVLNDSFKLITDIHAIVEMSKRKSTLLPDIWAEGIVIRSKDDYSGKSFSFKAINPEFLLKFGE